MIQHALIPPAPEVEPDDGINWAAPKRRHSIPAPAQTARRICLACDLSYVVPLDYAGPPLCEGCRSDLDATRARVRQAVERNMAQAMAALDRWDAARNAQEAAWERIQDARGLADFAAKAAAHRAAHNVYGRLLEAEEEYQRAVGALEAEDQRLRAALEALHAIQ